MGPTGSVLAGCLVLVSSDEERGTGATLIRRCALCSVPCVTAVESDHPWYRYMRCLIYTDVLSNVRAAS